MWLKWLSVNLFYANQGLFEYIYDFILGRQTYYKKAVTCKYNSSGFYITRWWNKAHTIRNDSIVWDSFTMGNSCTAVDKSNIRERNRLSKNV